MYNGGENVTGHVYLDIVQNFGSGVLTLSLTGEESSDWIEVNHIFEDPNAPRQNIAENELCQ